jgi:hypothetical protein
VELLQFLVFGLLVPAGIVACFILLGVVRKRRRGRRDEG